MTETHKCNDERRGAPSDGGSAEAVSPPNLADLTFVALVSPGATMDGLVSPISPVGGAGGSEPVKRSAEHAAEELPTEAGTDTKTGEPSVLSATQLREKVFEHFGSGGKCENLLQLSGNEITAAVAAAWMDLPERALKKQLEEANAIEDEGQKKVALARVTEFRKSIEIGKREIEGSEASMTPGRVDKLTSPFWSYVITMAVSTATFCGASLALGAACWGGTLAVAPTLAAFGALAVTNRLVCWWCSRNCDDDFDSTVKKAFLDALEAADTPFKQVTYTAALAYMVQAWKSRALVAHDTFILFNPDKDNSLHTGMAYLENAMVGAMQSLYGQSNGITQAIKDPLFDQSLKRFQPFLDKLKKSWSVAPGTLDAAAEFTTVLGVAVGSVASIYLAISWLTPYLP
jgi:hypothetical protein